MFDCAGIHKQFLKDQMKEELTELKQKLGESEGEGESQSILSVIRSNQSSFDMSIKPASFMSSS